VGLIAKGKLHVATDVRTVTETLEKFGKRGGTPTDCERKPKFWRFARPEGTYIISR